MLTNSDQSLHVPIKAPLPGYSPSRARSSLSLPEPEPWRKTSPSPVRCGLAPGNRSCSLQVPNTVPGHLGLPLRAASFDMPRAGDDSDQGTGSQSPHSAHRRRGGLVEQKDVIMAHQSHKIQSTPQARRKEWE
ncbi:unnamed protein product [Knipowitschia caucasica]|uniref:Uncharacterized protein n=1 Tax=Knipowitschia caucasica TaxID=637954 RepID=A0AAV2JP67_KNICA